MVDTQCPFCREKDEELARLRYATIPPEAGENLIERLKEYDSDSMWEGGLNPPFRQVFKDAAATIRSLVAENERWTNVSAEGFKSLQEAEARAERAEAENEELTDQRKRLREVIKAYTDVSAETLDRAERAEADCDKWHKHWVEERARAERAEANVVHFQSILEYENRERAEITRLRAEIERITELRGTENMLAEDHIRNAIVRAEKAEAELAGPPPLKQEVQHLDSQIKILLAENARLREALEWIAKVDADNRSVISRVALSNSGDSNE